MDGTLSNLHGFARRLLRHPPLALGITLSFFHLIWLCVTVPITMLPAFIVYMLDLKWAAPLALIWWAVSSLLVGKFGTYVLQVWKYRYANWRFWIVALRPFHERSSSYMFRHLVAPTLGCYGAVNVVSDESFVQCEEKVDDSMVDFQVLGDAPVAMNTSDEKWRKEVSQLIALSDLAVIDLTLPSVNLLWETACCVQLLPPHRIFLIGVEGISWHDTLELVREYLAKFLPDGAPSIVLPRPISYDGFLFGTWRFRLRIFRAMRAIRRLDREAAVSGSWHLPKYLQDG